MTMKRFYQQLQKYTHTAVSAVVLTVFAFQFIFPQHVAAAATVEPETRVLLPKLTISEGLKSTETVVLARPYREYEVVDTYKITVTAYSSTVDQTDSTPCFTANDFDLCTHNREDVIAANFLPFGTKVRIPEYFGDRIFTVQDRMNARYYYRADVWFKTRADAVTFRAPYTVVEVVK